MKTGSESYPGTVIEEGSVTGWFAPGEFSVHQKGQAIVGWELPPEMELTIHSQGIGLPFEWSVREIAARKFDLRESAHRGEPPDESLGHSRRPLQLKPTGGEATVDELPGAELADERAADESASPERAAVEVDPDALEGEAGDGR